MHLLVISVLLVFGFPFILSDVVDSFSKCSQFFLDGHPPVIKGILEGLESKDKAIYKPICQKYENIYRFATLYDTTNKIPVFSAYKYIEKVTFPRPKGWRTEEKDSLQLDKQASNEVYCNNNKNVNRGHLFPNSHAPDLVNAKSTFTLTNAVPQKISFNSGSWNHMEQKNIQVMDSHCKDQNNKVSAYVLTGAVPGEDKLKEVVNIPKYMWTAFCCYSKTDNSLVSLAHWAENKDETGEKGKTIDGKTLQQLQKFLKDEWKVEVQLFNKDCSNAKLLSVTGSQVTEPREQDDDDPCKDN